jgi:hypothetical protein
LAVLADAGMALHFPFLAGGPLVLVFFLVGYLKPKRGRIKVNMLSIAIVVAVLYTIYVMGPFGSDLIYATWGMGGAILLAGGFAMLDPMEVSVSPGIMEVSDLKYKPEPEPLSLRLQMRQRKPLKTHPQNRSAYAITTIISLQYIESRSF